MTRVRIGAVAMAVVLVLAAGVVSTPVSAETQSAMRAALQSLKQAKAQLQKGTSDKGGHRVKAIDLVDQAISEVEKGIAYDAAR
jgi:hypothetical protein